MYRIEAAEKGEGPCRYAGRRAKWLRNPHTETFWEVPIGSQDFREKRLRDVTLGDTHGNAHNDGR